MLNIELPCKIEENVSKKSGNTYMAVSIQITPDYALKFFPSSEQQAIIRMAFGTNKSKIKMSNNHQED